MATFLKADAIKTLEGKSVLFLGDSILRNIYQDFVTLLHTGSLTNHDILSKKGEQITSYLGDTLMNNTGKLVAGRDYREERRMLMEKNKIRVRYWFLTRCWSNSLQEYLDRVLEEDGGSPDVVIVLSCIWDINRWGSGGIDKYKTNCQSLLDYFEPFKKTQVLRSFILLILSHSSLKVIWLTCPPISVEVWGGFMVEGVVNAGIRFNIMEGNTMVANTVASMGQDVVDLHYWMLHMVYLRKADGLHWTQDAVRLQTNIILTHLCTSRDIPLPDSDQEDNELKKQAERLALIKTSDKHDDTDSDSDEEVNDVKIHLSEATKSIWNI